MRNTILFMLFAVAARAAEPNVESLIENGHWKRAREAAQAMYQAHPNDARAICLLARIRHEFGNLEEAVKLAEGGVRLDPKSSACHRELGEALADQADKVSFLKKLSLARRIHPEFDTALSLAPKDPDNIFDQIQYLEEAPGVVGGDKKKAAQLANELLTIDKTRGYLALAYLARKEKEEGKLEGLFQKAVESNPRNHEAQTTLAAFYVNSKQPNFSAAEQHARAALDLNSDRVDAYRLLAYILVMEKRLDEAARVVARAESAVPDDLSPLVYIARAMLRDNVELPKAEAYLKKYLSETKEPEPNAPSIAGVHWSLGLVYEKEGRIADARSELETALKLKSDFEPAKRDLKRLK
jgi:tetratricopeptide (TPR) repeat protein